MAKIKFYPVFFLVFLFCSFYSFAQQQSLPSTERLTNPNQNIQEEAIEQEIVTAESQWQYLEWIEDYPEYVSHYDVVVEKLEAGNYEQVRSLSTNDNSTKIQITPALKPGNYRYKIITYNLIGIAEVESEWTSFNIYIAYQPEIKSVTVDSNLTSTIYLEEINDGIISVSGRNLFMPKQNPNDITFTQYVLKKIDEKETSEITFTPSILKHSENNRNITFQFNANSFDVGTYSFIAQDASGLENPIDSASMITVKFRKKLDIDLSAGYACPVVLFDETIEEYFGTKVFPVSAYFKLNIIPFKHRWGYLGFGLQSTYTRMFADHNDYSIEGNLFTGFFTAVYQFPIRLGIKNSISTKHIATIELHGGLGLTMFNDFTFNFGHSVTSQKLNSTNFSVDAGISLQFYVSNRLFIETDADFICAYITDMNFGMLISSVGVGWQF
ncbi:hypothetical protein HRO26_00140 [Treponema pectinovorum]|uniref:hypothetical protein n=1 Tax=Treponema pectinovorum TaxID=164 RepID=UPI003D9198F6